MAAASIIIALLLLAIAPPASSFSDKCSACQAVAAELEMGLLNAWCKDIIYLVPDSKYRLRVLQEIHSSPMARHEKPRNHLDMRHRLDSKGQREGKLIDYKVSELRVVELLDGLCAKMKGYTLETTGPGKGTWLKIDALDPIKDRQEADAYSKQMTTYCGRLLEETEEELEERIKNGSVHVGQVENTLCWELSQHCSFPREEKRADTDTAKEEEL